MPEGGAFAALCGRESPGCRFDVQKDLMIEAAGVVCSCGLFCAISPACSGCPGGACTSGTADICRATDSERLCRELPAVSRRIGEAASPIRLG